MPYFDDDCGHCYGFRVFKISAQQEKQRRTWWTVNPTWHQARLAARQLRIHIHQHSTMIPRTPRTIKKNLFLIARNWYVDCAGLIGAKHWGKEEGYELTSHLVFEKYRGQGVGEALLQGLFKELRMLRAPSLFLCTTQVGYYQRFGFVVVDPSRCYSEKIRTDCQECKHGPKGPGFGTCPETVMKYAHELPETVTEHPNKSFQRDRYMFE